MNPSPNYEHCVYVYTICTPHPSKVSCHNHENQTSPTIRLLGEAAVTVFLCNVEGSAKASVRVAAVRCALRGSSAVAGDELRAGGLARGGERRSGGSGGTRDRSGRGASNRSSGGSVEAASVTILLSDEPRCAETLHGVAAARCAVAVTAAGTGDELGASRCGGRGCAGGGSNDDGGRGDDCGRGGYGGSGSTAIASAVVAVFLSDELRSTGTLDGVTAS